MNGYEKIEFLYPYNWNYTCDLQEDVIERFKKCMMGIWSVDDKNDWPVKLNHISHLFAREFTLDFLQCMDELQQEYTLEEIGKLFGHPTKIFRTFDLLLKGMYKLGFTSEKKRKIIHNILGCTQLLKAGSIFNEDGNNIIFPPDVINEICSKKLLPITDEEQIRKLQLMIGLLKAYIEQLYFRGYDISQEIHGSYPIKEKSKLMIRQFENLSPSKLWPDFKLLPLDKIQIYTVYNDELHICIDSYNHLYQSKGTFSKTLSYAGMEAEGGKKGTVDLDLLIQELSKCIQYNAQVMKDMDWKQAAVKYIDIFYFKLNPLFAETGYKPQYKNKAKENIEKGDMIANSEQFFQKGKIQLLLNLLL